MKNISSQYQELQEGKMTKHQFLRNARMMFPSFVTNQNSFADSVAILKTKGMLVEGDAVKGTPDKEPTYDSPTPDAKTKYKKVEQSPEVDEQDGVYPATTLTDIPKVKANKKVKDTSSGLEPIKNKDTKNEMKKVRVVKEGVQNAAASTAKKDITVYAAQQRKLDNAARKGHSGDLPSDSNTVGASHVFDKDSTRLNKDLKKDYPELNKESINYDNLSKHSIKDLESLIDLKKKEREKLRSNTNIPPAVQNTVKELGAQISKIEREINSKKAQSLGENVSPEDLKGAEKEITKNDASIKTMANRLGISEEELFKMLLKRLGGLNEYSSDDDEPYYSDIPKKNPNKRWDTDDDVEDRYDDDSEDEENDDINESTFSKVWDKSKLTKTTYEDGKHHSSEKFKTVEDLLADKEKTDAIQKRREEKGKPKTDHILKENEKSFDDVLKNFLDTDDSTEIRAFIKAKGRDAIAKIKAKLPALKDQARQKLAKLMKIELDEVRAKQAPTLSIKERLKPAITKLVQEVLDEMGQ